MPEGGGGFITQKVGPLPLVVWVMGGAGVVFVFLMMRHGSSSGGQANATNSVSALAPTEAEAFGTIEQQQQDVVNALTTLGNNQSALGGSLSTLGGTIDTNQNYNVSQFSNILSGLSQVQQGQGTAANTAASYNTTLLQQLANYYASLNTTVVNGNTGVSQQISGVSNQINGVSGQVAGVQSSVGGTQADVDALGRFLGWQFYQIPNRYAAYIPGQGPGNAGGSPIGTV